jgi:ankyrin repeat protein
LQGQEDERKPAEDASGPTDDAAIEFATRIFQLARGGAAADLRPHLEAGLPVNLTNGAGDTLLMLAAYNRNPEVVELLIAFGAALDAANDRGQTPLGAVAYNGDLAIAKMLVEAGADVAGGAGKGRNALMMAAMFDRAEILTLLLENGADPQAQDPGGMTAIDMARVMGAQSTPDLLERWIARSREGSTSEPG